MQSDSPIGPRGSQDNLEALMRQYEPALRHYVREIIPAEWKSEIPIEDVLQEVRLEILRQAMSPRSSALAHSSPGRELLRTAGPWTSCAPPARSSTAGRRMPQGISS
ncbi:MAG TPA: hypothetical protein VGM03_08620, partial [Phycisphaerae bacterium]